MSKLISTQYLRDELRSFFTTFVTYMAVDGIMELTAIYNGDLSEAAFIALVIAMGRALIKAAFTLLMPALFPIRRSL